VEKSPPGAPRRTVQPPPPIPSTLDPSSQPWSALHFGTQDTTAQDRRKEKSLASCLRDNRNRSFRQPDSQTAAHVRPPPHLSQLFGPLRSLALRGVRNGLARISVLFPTLKEAFLRSTEDTATAGNLNLIYCCEIISPVVVPFTDPPSVGCCIDYLCCVRRKELRRTNNQPDSQTCDCERSRLRTREDSLGTTFAFAWLGGVLRKAKDSQTP
jgi:hypothetical protein